VDEGECAAVENRVEIKIDCCYDRERDKNGKNPLKHTAEEHRVASRGSGETRVQWLCPEAERSRLSPKAIRFIPLFQISMRWHDTAHHMPGASFRGRIPFIVLLQLNRIFYGFED
jgi:hypothetical protein